jgi:hypothetical protein
MYWKDIVEFSFYLVETFALPFAIIVYVFERRKERLAEEEELNQRLSDEYIGFLKLVLENADLQLLHRRAPLRELSEEQQERRFTLFGILVSIFERAYILVYDEHMNRQTRRLWRSWEGAVGRTSGKHCLSSWKVKIRSSAAISKRSPRNSRANNCWPATNRATQCGDYGGPANRWNRLTGLCMRFNLQLFSPCPQSPQNGLYPKTPFMPKSPGASFP